MKPSLCLLFLALIITFLLSGCSKFNWKNETVYEIQEDTKNDESSLSPSPLHPSPLASSLHQHSPLPPQIPDSPESTDPSEPTSSPKNANTDDLIPAHMLADDLIPAHNTDPQPPPTPPQPSCVHLNTSDKSQLMTLPGVGEKRADEIIKKRSRQPFKKKTDITKIKGIGKKTYNKIASRLCDI